MGISPAAFAGWLIQAKSEMEALFTAVTELLVEQNAFAALKVAHYAYVLETGSIVLQGTGEELLNDERVIDAYLGG